MPFSIVLTDPNVVYTIVWIGLWITVTVAHAPGSIIGEILAFVGLSAAALLLLALPTNWAAVLLIVSGVIGFIFVPFIKQQYTTLSLLGLVLQALGGYFLFNGLSVSPLVIGVTIGLSLAYHFFILLPALRRMKEYTPPTSDEALIGAVGRVVMALDPVGTVQCNSELWSATSNKRLPSGTRVIVKERNGLQLYVEAEKDKREPEHDEILEV